MASVTQRISTIKQPYGGYLKPTEFQKIEFNDNETLSEENIHSSLVGLAVDYLTRFMLGTSPIDAFEISLKGALIIRDSEHSVELLKSIKGLDDDSIYCACQLVGYDVCFRSSPLGYKDVRTIDPDKETINNIRIMVNRSLEFFKEYGPIVKDGFTFEGGYTSTINTGDGDFLTKDTLWDFKVSSSAPKTSHTLQLLVYYIMGQHSIHEEFKNIKKLGIYNPRLNCVYLKEIDQIPKETIETVSKEVICYGKKSENSDNDLSITDLMKELQCTRYTVMKYYTNDELPLEKKGNKYYISRSEFEKWLEYMEEKRRERVRLTIIISLAIIIFLIIVIIAIN